MNIIVKIIIALAALLVFGMIAVCFSCAVAFFIAAFIGEPVEDEDESETDNQ